ncbi:MAG: hypothetical protein FWE14_04940 [Lachnospiraceae bacterium]|nr:hypothetical protein [Lachnospiraceae bacterium]
MTLKELSQLYYLIKEIKIDQLRLEELQAKAEGTSSGFLSELSKAPNFESKLEKYIVEKVDLANIIFKKQQRCIDERARLEQYINDIDDSYTRMIFSLRFIDGLSWDKVADHIGGGNTDQSVKKRCYRHLDKSS